MEKAIGIAATQVSKAFGKQQVLRDVNLQVPGGRVLGVVGQNGSGKTVLMKCLCGFLRPDAGSIVINGQRVGQDCDFPDRMGMILETPGFLSDLSGYRNLRNLAALKGRIGKSRVEECLRIVGLFEARHKTVANYSLGMRQRLGIAQAIMEDPDVLVLDEPFNGLDRQSTEEIRALLKALRAQGKAILLASHNAADIAALCDDVLEMDVQHC